MPFELLIRLVVAETPSQGLPAVRVGVFDSNQTTDAHRLGAGTTDDNGEARVHLAHLPQGLGGILPRLDALRAAVFAPDGDVVLMVPLAGVQVPSHRAMTIPIGRDLIARFGLAPAKHPRTPHEKQHDWIDAWRKRLSGGHDPRGPIDLCLTRVVLDMMAGAVDPKVDLQKRTAQALARELPPDQIARLSEVAARARDLIDGSGLLRGRRCSAESSPAEIWQTLIGPGGPLNALNQALVETEPDPRANLGAPTAGQARLVEYVFAQKCIELLRAGGLTGQALADMRQYYDPLHPLQLVAPPVVKQVGVYDQAIKHTVRDADVRHKMVQLFLLDAQEGLAQSTLNMAVGPTHEDFLVDLIDEADGLQALVVDARPGQTITLTGDGFASAKALVGIQYAAWEAIPSDAATPAVLRPLGFGPATGWPDHFDVYGAATYGNDKIVFDWPLAAVQPGLYRLELQFENSTGHKVLVQSQRDDDCRVQVADALVSQPLFFAVLPALQSKPVSVKANQVDAVRITRPPFWPDDVGLTGATQVERFTYDTSDPNNPRVVPATLSNSSWDKGSSRLWWDQSWHPGSPSLLADGQATQVLGFGSNFTDAMTVALSANEVDGSFDRQGLGVILKGVLITLGVLAAALIIVAWAVLAVIVILIAVAVAVLTAVTGPAAATVAAGVIGAMAAVAAALIGAVAALVVASFPLVDSALAAFISGSDSICNATLWISSTELALRLSNVRFHRRVWRISEHVTSSSNSFSATHSDSPSALQEVYDGSNGDVGGQYRVHLELKA